MDLSHGTDLNAGLASEEVMDRARAGKVNVQPKGGGKPVSRIVTDNVFTFFNLINGVIGALLLSVGSYKNTLFLFVNIINTVAGIVQELRAKRALERLTLLSAAKASAIRGGREVELPVHELVMDDIMVLRPGQQICADGILREGRLEVDESLITGESDPVLKNPGDEVLSGSFVSSGSAKAQVIRVGMESYAGRVAGEAKVRKRHNSILRSAMNAILKFSSAIIVPLGALLFIRQRYSLGLSMAENAVSTASAVLGMIPQGLVLLTTMALTVGVINLSRRNTLVRELFCIETLSRVDVLCLDKTGTLTEGRMKVTEVVPLSDQPLDEMMGNLLRVLPDDNETNRSMARHFEKRDTFAVQEVWPFSSERKLSGARFEGQGACLIGAYEFLTTPERRRSEILERIEEYAAKGARVLAMGVCEGYTGEEPPADIEIWGLILLRDEVRPEAKETLSYFREQGVKLMILSGDHPATASRVAERAGVPGAEHYVDVSGLADSDISAAVANNIVFGRVVPERKKLIIQALKASGHTVAMIGDGANDVPALKEADCGVAMAQGADAAKQCADLVLLDSDFAAMPFVVREGRRVVNNIKSAATLFLNKTFYSIFLTILSLCFSLAYPFTPIQLTLISACAVGIPTFFYALEPNDKPIGPDFFGPVLKGALAAALCSVLWVVVTAFAADRLSISPEVRSTMCLITTGVVGLFMIPRVYALKGLIRKLVFGGMWLLFFGAIGILPELFAASPLPRIPAMLTGSMAVATPLVLWGTSGLVGKILEVCRRG